eukprot:PhF_6_TR30794/c0_g1_i1/m.45340
MNHTPATTVYQRRRNQTPNTNNNESLPPSSWALSIPTSEVYYSSDDTARLPQVPPEYDVSLVRWVSSSLVSNQSSGSGGSSVLWALTMFPKVLWKMCVEVVSAVFWGSGS